MLHKRRQNQIRTQASLRRHRLNLLANTSKQCKRSGLLIELLQLVDLSSASLLGDYPPSAIVALRDQVLDVLQSYRLFGSCPLENREESSLGNLVVACDCRQGPSEQAAVYSQDTTTYLVHQLGLSVAQWPAAGADPRAGLAD